MKTTYKNRYNSEFIFELNSKDNIQWSGDFQYCRYGFSLDGTVINMVDPSGGPYICEGMDMKLFEFEGMIVDHFIKNEQGYEIIVKK